MCGPAIIPIIASVAGAVVSSALAPKQKAPKSVDAPAAPAQSQAARMPDQAAARQSAQGMPGGVAGPASTMLTGTGGVAPGGLNLGRNTLLGA